MAILRCRRAINDKFFVAHYIVNVLDSVDTARSDFDFFANDGLLGDVDLLFGERDSDRFLSDRLALYINIARGRVTFDHEFFAAYGHID